MYACHQCTLDKRRRPASVNCKDGDDFKAAMEKWFGHVFMFSMNDEVVHTGFSPMAHYIFGVGCSLKEGFNEDA